MGSAAEASSSFWCSSGARSRVGVPAIAVEVDAAVAGESDGFVCEEVGHEAWGAEALASAEFAFAADDPPRRDALWRFVHDPVDEAGFA